MKKSEMIQELIEIEEESEIKSTISMNYLHYLKQNKKLVEVGDIELK